MSKILYFTSTGNSLYVAKKIKENLYSDIEINSISKMIKEEEYEVDDDFVGIIYPLHCYGLPILVEEFLKKLKIKKDAYIFVVQVTGGHSSNYSFKQVEDILKEKGAKVSNYALIKYISNYIRAGRNPSEERAKESIAREEATLNNFIASLKEREIKKCEFKNNLISSTAYKLWKDKFKNKDKDFNVNDECIGCHMCQVVCPTKNIVISNEKLQWLGKCVDCMACINICPVQAINIGKKTQKKNRYKNPYINTRELL